jgi:hypothetical protein
VLTSIARGDRLSRSRRGFAALAAAVAAGSIFIGVRPVAADSAHAARTIQVSETAHLHLTSHHGITLNLEGSASGTISGRIYIHLQLRSGGRVFAEVNIYPRGGSLSGNGTASYRVAGAYADFDGTFAVTRGTGKWAHARASGMRFAGSIQRRTDATSVTLSGKLSE